MVSDSRFSLIFLCVPVAPNPAMFVLEPSTGYFLDPVTNFYYDAKTSYYYNNETREWTEWDATYQTYFPVQSVSLLFTS